MRYFVDNDIIHKLARLKLLSQLVDVLSCKNDDIFVLPSARFYFNLHKPTEGKRKFGEETFSLIETFVNQVKALTTEEPTIEHAAALADIPGIQTGEQLLYGVAASSPDIIVVTGDKVSIKALATTPKCTNVAALLKNRVICLEQIIQKLILRNGYDAVQEAFIVVPDCDKGLKLIFGLAKKPESHVRDGLDSFVGELRKLQNSLLVCEDVS